MLTVIRRTLVLCASFYTLVALSGALLLAVLLSTSRVAAAMRGRELLGLHWSLESYSSMQKG